jgi:hypothetical protein
MDQDVHGEVAWRKSRYSMSNGNCVEATPDPTGIAVRDSANRAGVMIRYSAQAWHAFVERTKADKFDVTIE